MVSCTMMREAPCQINVIRLISLHYGSPSHSDQNSEPAMCRQALAAARNHSSGSSVESHDTCVIKSEASSEAGPIDGCQIVAW